MPYKSLSEAPESWKKLDGTVLTLDQVNQIAKVFDALVKQGKEKGSAASIAISQFKMRHEVKDGKWVKVEKNEKAEEIEATEVAEDAEKAEEAKETVETQEENLPAEEPEPEVAPAPDPLPADFMVEERIDQDAASESGLVLNLCGHILLEEKDPARTDFIRARVPMIKFGAYTDNGNRYFEECWDALGVQIKELRESNATRRVLDMYPTHKPALDPKDPNYFMLRAAKITGVSREGDVGLIHFETLRTEAGRTMAVQVQEGMVDGVSLRAYPRHGYFTPNDKGGHDVRQLALMGCDFTDVGAMPIDEDKKGFHLEEKKVMPVNLEELKESDPEAWLRIPVKLATHSV